MSVKLSAPRALLCAALVGLGLVANLVRAEEEVAEKSLVDKTLADRESTKGFGDAGLSLNGYVQGSWTHSFSNPPGNVITGRGFDFENDDATLNGIAINFHRDIEADGKKFDIGFGIDTLYGGDARFMHSNGMFDNRGFVFNAAGDADTGPDEQFDLPQAYVTFALPVGRGLLITAGKFVTPIGYEYVDPRKNTLYSHSFLFNFAAPFSQTGVMGKYNVSDTVKVSAGITRGWDQSTKDNNGEVDFLGVVEYAPDEKWSFTLAVSSGPQQDSGNDWRTELDFLASYLVSETWTLGAEALYGIESDAPGSGDQFSQWYGLAVYPSYKLDDIVSLNGRAEWFSDNDLSRGVGAMHVFEVTLGCSITPLQDTALLKIRPEIRMDYSGGDPIFDGGTDYYQTTFAVDAVFAF